MQITAKRRWLISTMLILFTLTIVLTSIIFARTRVHAAAPTGHHNPLINATVPTITRNARTTTTSVQAIYNALLNSTADQGDIADPAAAPPALCASYTTNPYAKPFPNVDMINGDTTVTVGTQTGCKAAQNETTIAANPRDPRNLVAGTNDYRIFNSRENRNDGSGWAYTTKDGGRTWTDVQLPHLTFQTGATGALSDMDSAGDPSVSFGPNNTVYYANLVFSRLNSGSGIVINVSHDGGLTWGEPSIVHVDGVDAAGNPVATNVANDKEWVAVDPRNSQVAYITWTTFLSDNAGNNIGSPIVVSSTHDGGLTWSAPTQVTPTFTAGGITPFDQGSNPVVDRFGTLYVAYEGAICQDLTCSAATDHDEVIVAKSIDGGHTFTNALVDVDYDFPVNPHVGRETLTGENFRINSFPQLTIDRATNVLYTTWADDRHGQYDANGNSVKTNGDALVVSSLGGTVWNNEITVGSTSDEVYPAIAAFAGRVMVSYYTRAFNPTGINLDYAFSSVLVIGLTHLHASPVIRITEQSENPQVQFVAQDLVNPNNYLQGVFIGDYTAIAVSPDGRFHPCWTDFRGNPGVNFPNQDAYTQSI